jgi:hypothetical protein
MIKPALDMSSYVPYHFVPLTKGQLTLSCPNNRRSTPCPYRHNNWLADFFVGTGPKAPKIGSKVLKLQNRSHVRHLLPEGLLLLVFPSLFARDPVCNQDLHCKEETNIRFPVVREIRHLKPPFLNCFREIIPTTY